MGAAFTQWFRGLVPGHSLLSHSTNTVRLTQPQEMTQATMYCHNQSKIDSVLLLSVRIITIFIQHNSIFIVLYILTPYSHNMYNEKYSKDVGA